jgi:hypothetical protein
MIVRAHCSNRNAGCLKVDSHQRQVTACHHARTIVNVRRGPRIVPARESDRLSVFRNSVTAREQTYDRQMLQTAVHPVKKSAHDKN